MNPISIARKMMSMARAGRKRRSALAAFETEVETRGQMAPNSAVIGVYFADSDVNLYQMRQWYGPLREISKTWPVLLITRNPTAAEALIRESGLDVALAPRVVDLEQLTLEQPLKLILYVNQNTRNFQMMRYGARLHVFINHGESDKMYMTTNQVKTYDYSLIAGKAARDRLTTHLWNYDVGSRTIEIGRPQTDFLRDAPPFQPDERTTVLYSPTWEGDRPAASYGSVVSHGESIAQAVLSSPTHRLIYRPHPRTGVEDRAFKEANSRIKQAIVEANDADPNAQHVFDDSPDLGWQLSKTDIAICDISAMIYDRLATGNPVVVTRPISPEALIDDAGYLGACEWLSAAEAPNILSTIDRIMHDTDARKKTAYWAEHYFGDTRPGQPTLRFTSAIETLLDRWEQELLAHQRSQG